MYLNNFPFNIMSIKRVELEEVKHLLEHPPRNDFQYVKGEPLEFDGSWSPDDYFEWVYVLAAHLKPKTVMMQTTSKLLVSNSQSMLLCGLKT